MYKKKSKGTFTIFDMVMCSRCIIGAHNQCTGMRRIDGQSDRHCECRECRV